MSQDQPRAEQSSKDRIVEEVADKVEQSPAVHASREEIEARVEESVDELIDQPVQTFTPLLAQNKVVGGLVGDKQDQRAPGDSEEDPA